MWLLILLALSIVFIILTTTRFKLHPFLSLLLAAFGYGICSGTMSLTDVAKAVNTGFGNTIGYIGIVILAGSIIGIFLEKSGGAFTLAERIVRLVGQRNVPLAMSIIGYIVSIPVFCDSGFVILAPLARALSRRARIPLAASAVALSLGLYSTHTMVPPTPGPIAAAGILNADLGLVTLWGVFVALIALVAGWIFAVLIAGRAAIDGAPGPEDVNPPDLGADPGQTQSRLADESHRQAPFGEGGLAVRKTIAKAFGLDDATRQGRRKIPDMVHSSDSAIALEADRPSAVKSLVPILLPIVLIVMKSVVDLPNVNSRPFGQSSIAAFLSFAGQPVVALLLGVFLAFLLPRKITREMLSTSGWVGEAVLAAATIIIITGSGGAFGNVLKNSGISGFITAHMSQTKGLSILLPFLIAAALKTAQGSSTVAIITTAGILAPLLGALGLDSPTGRALAVVTIGAGSMVVSHVNDSYFWVVTGFSKMSVKEGYKYQTLGTLVEGCTAACTVWAIGLFVL
jgi:GntP family gluconate:H+ symporter